MPSLQISLKFILFFNKPEILNPVYTWAKCNSNCSSTIDDLSSQTAAGCPPTSVCSRCG